MVPTGGRLAPLSWEHRPYKVRPHSLLPPSPRSAGHPTLPGASVHTHPRADLSATASAAASRVTRGRASKRGGRVGGAERPGAADSLEAALRLEEWRARDLRALVPWNLSCAAFTACVLALLSPFRPGPQRPLPFRLARGGPLDPPRRAERLPFRLRATLFLCADYAVVLLAAAGSPSPGAIAFAYAVALVSLGGLFLRRPGGGDRGGPHRGRPGSRLLPVGSPPQAPSVSPGGTRPSSGWPPCSAPPRRR